MIAWGLPIASLEAAPQSSGGGAPTTITLSARGEDVRSVLKAVFAKVPDVKYRIDEGVRGTVTVGVRDLPLDAALRAIVRASTVPLELRREDGIWVISLRRAASSSSQTSTEAKSSPGAGQGDPSRVTLRVVDARLPDVLSVLFDKARKDAPHFGAKYRVMDASAREARVTVQIDGRSLSEALDQIARAAKPGVAWRKSPENVYEFHQATGVAVVTAAAVPTANSESSAALPRVSVDVRDGDVRSVLADVFRQAKVVNYTLANDVIGYVTLKIKDRPLEEALALVCRTAVPPLRYRKTPEGVYEVRVRTYGNTASLSAPQSLPVSGNAFGEIAAAATRTSDWEAIPLMYAEADVLSEAMNTLRPEGVTRVIGFLPTNALIVKAGDLKVEGFLAFVLGYGMRGATTPPPGGNAGGGGSAAGAGPGSGGTGGNNGGPAAISGGGGTANP